MTTMNSYNPCCIASVSFQQKLAKTLKIFHKCKYISKNPSRLFDILGTLFSYNWHKLYIVNINKRFYQRSIKNTISSSSGRSYRNTF